MKNSFLTKLSKIEKDGAVDIFNFKNSTSWINIKNYLYTKSLQDVINTPTDNKKDFFSIIGLKLFIFSIFNYIKYIFSKEKKVLYVGAGSGIFKYKNTIYDSYFPYDELKNEKVIYFLSAEYPKKLQQFEKYLKDNNVVIYSFLLAPLKIIFTKIFKYFIKINIPHNLIDNFEKGFINKTQLQTIHVKFIVAYYIYKFFLMLLNIKKAYIVSAYSNTELIAVLKEKNIEVIELQHGLIGTVHRGYNYATKSPLLPTPNMVYVYDQFWKDELIKAGYYTNEQIKITGRLKYDLVNKDIKIYNNKFIVFTGQGSGFYKDIIRLFNDFENTQNKKGIKLIYIPHPNESANKINTLSSNFSSQDIIILKQKKFTTEQYIYNALAHISIYSSCHFDAIYYKNKTYVYDSLKENPMEYYIKEFPNRFIAIKSIKDIKL